MEVKPGYIRTEVGVIPEDWDVTDLGSCLELLTDFEANGSFESVAQNVSVYDSEGYAWYVRATDLENGTDPCKVKYVDRASYQFLKKTRLFGGEVLITKRGEIGKVYFFLKRTERATLGPNLYLLKLKDKVSPYYIYSFFRFGFGNNQLTEKNASTTLGALYKDDVKAIWIPLPPIKAEQVAIAEVLSDADALIESLGKLIAKKRHLKQGALQELLTGKRRLPGFEFKNGYKQTELGAIPEDWEVAKLSGICSMKSGEGITSAKIDQFSKYPCYGGNGLRGFTTRFTHDGSYALIGRQGALCGNVLGVEGTFFASEHAIVVAGSGGTDIHWLTFVLGQMRLNQYSESSAQPGLSVAKLLSLDLALPPTKSEQESIAMILSDMDSEIAALEAKLVKACQIKQGMMQELVTGRIRLI